MTDRRNTPANERAALGTLPGIVDAPLYVAGDAARIAVPLADLCRAPSGARDRQLLLGDLVTVIERQDRWAFVQAGKDGYCGYLSATCLAPARAATHWVAAAATHLYPEARVQAHEIAALSFGSLLTVTGQTERFAETPDGFVPATHLRPVDHLMTDPVAVAELFLGTPYLWGGNSRAGIDCSGLVQASHLACGIACPGDSDLQAQSVGAALDPEAPLQRGDLIFWQGHVAILVDDHRVIHANGHAMATAYEGTTATIARIAAAGYPVQIRRRP